MCSVARGRTSGGDIRSAAASSRKRSVQRWASVADRDPLGRRAADDLVVDVGDVHHPGHPQAAIAQVAHEQVGEQERAEVADMGRPIDRRSAGVDPDVAGLERDRARASAAERVEQADASSAALRAIATADALDSPAAALPAFEVAGRGLDVDRPSARRRAARRSPPRISSRRRPELRPGRHDRQVERTRAARPPRAGARSTTRSSSLLAIPAGVCGPAGNRRPEIAQAAAPRSASATA